MNTRNGQTSRIRRATQCLAGVVIAAGSLIAFDGSTASAIIPSGGGGTAQVTTPLHPAVVCKERTNGDLFSGWPNILKEGVNIPIRVVPEPVSNWTVKPVTGLGPQEAVYEGLESGQKIKIRPWVYNWRTEKWIRVLSGNDGWFQDTISKEKTYQAYYRAPGSTTDGTTAAKYSVYVEFQWLRPTGWTSPQGEWAPAYAYESYYLSGVGLGSGYYQKYPTQCVV